MGLFTRKMVAKMYIYMKDVYIHVSELERAGYRDLDVGDNICYELKTNKKGKEQAVNIKII